MTSHLLLPSHIAYEILISSERNREGAVKDAIFGVGKFRILDLWTANSGRSQGATAEKANAVPERCPSILFQTGEARPFCI